jgi:hypothetical protein
MHSECGDVVKIDLNTNCKLKRNVWASITKDRQYKGQKTKEKQHIVQSNIHKAKERVTRTPLKTGGELRCSVSQSILKNGLILSFKQFFGWCHLLVVKHCCAKWQKMVFAIKVWFKVDYCFPIISIKSGRVKLVLWIQTPVISIILVL